MNGYGGSNENVKYGPIGVSLLRRYGFVGVDVACQRKCVTGGALADFRCSDQA